MDPDMTRVLNDPSKEPGTHALVIGVGTYPYLQGGTGQPTTHVPLGQLDSPALSARVIAHWLLHRFNHPDRPLRTLQVLASDPGVNHSIAGLDPRVRGGLTTPDYHAVKAAAKHWLRRGNDHEGGQLLFFFCGHGVGNGVNVGLLLADFNKSGLSGMIDLARFRLAMRRAKAYYQTWFIDACRSRLAMVDAANGFLGNTPIAPAGMPHRISTVFHSTLEGKKAWGRSGKTTHFTDALVEAFDGGGARDIDGNGTWHVLPATLHSALQVPMRIAAREHNKAQFPATDGMSEDFSLHVLPGPPEVPLYLECIPEVITYDSTITCRTLRRATGRMKWCGGSH